MLLLWKRYHALCRNKAKSAVRLCTPHDVGSCNLCKATAALQCLNTDFDLIALILQDINLLIAGSACACSYLD